MIKKILQQNQIVNYHSNHRSDIDGLRAIAILLVVGYHASPKWFFSGFIGVDIFFVISGYLITRIILFEIHNQTFTLKNFYSRRICRLLPAFLILLSIVMVFGFFNLNSIEYKNLAKSVIFSSIFANNLNLIGSSGYFDFPASQKPLLHLWSLGVEEQFYIIWPTTILLAYKLNISTFKLLIFLVLASLALNIQTLTAESVKAFYYPHMRFYEIGIGALLAYKKPIYPRHGPMETIIILMGVCLITAGLLLIDNTKPFPGYLALLPTLGTACLIWSNEESFFKRYFLSNRILVFIGKVSYPWYLFHWPALAFQNLINRADPGSREYRFTVVIVSFILATIVYKFIEVPIRKKVELRPKITVFLILAASIFGAMATYVYFIDGIDGFNNRTKEKSSYLNFFDNTNTNNAFFHLIEQKKSYREACNVKLLEPFFSGDGYNKPRKEIAADCVRREIGKKSILILGDSNAQHLFYGLKRNLPADWHLNIMTASGCEIIFAPIADSSTNPCQKYNHLIHKVIARLQPEIVLVAKVDNHDFEKMISLEKDLLAAGVDRVILPGPVPQWERGLPTVIVEELWGNNDLYTFKGLRENIIEQNEALKIKFKAHETQSFVDLFSMLCRQDLGCRISVDGNRYLGLTAYDYGHLTPAGSDYLAKRIVDHIFNKDQ
ncbi:acyltransferase [Alphaproteobacteria bacterium]|nr:acyltransferase [Alphaproteobacteria bacterium]